LLAQPAGFSLGGKSFEAVDTTIRPTAFSSIVEVVLGMIDQQSIHSGFRPFPDN
jgi:hypothetical protein